MKFVDLSHFPIYLTPDRVSENTLWGYSGPLNTPGSQVYSMNTNDSSFLPENFPERKKNRAHTFTSTGSYMPIIIIYFFFFTDYITSALNFP